MMFGHRLAFGTRSLRGKNIASVNSILTVPTRFFQNLSDCHRLPKHLAGNLSNGNQFSATNDALAQQDGAHDAVVHTHSVAYARLCYRKRASSTYFLHRIAQGAQDAHALSHGFSQDAQHDQGVSALLAVGFAKPVSAIQGHRAIWPG